MNWKFWSICRLRILGFLGIIFAFAINANAQTCAPAPVGLVSWHAGEGNANDVSDNNKNAVLRNSAGFAVGRVRQGFNFDGINDFAKIPAGETYIVSVASKRYQFSQPTRVILVNDAPDDLDFMAIE